MIEIMKKSWGLIIGKIEMNTLVKRDELDEWKRKVKTFSEIN